jgi:hypothetical protein
MRMEMIRQQWTKSRRISSNSHVPHKIVKSMLVSAYILQGYDEWTAEWVV